MFGFYAFAFPKLSQKDRAASVPIHAFLGKTVLVLGLATMTVSLQPHDQSLDNTDSFELDLEISHQFLHQSPLLS